MDKEASGTGTNGLAAILHGHFNVIDSKF